MKLHGTKLDLLDKTFPPQKIGKMDQKRVNNRIF